MRPIIQLRIFITLIICSSSVLFFFPGQHLLVLLFRALEADFMVSLLYLCQQLILFPPVSQMLPIPVKLQTVLQRPLRPLSLHFLMNYKGQ